MKITAHANGSFSLVMTQDEHKTIGVEGSRRIKAYAMAKQAVNSHLVYDFFGSTSLGLALEVCNYYKLVREK